MPRDEHNMSNDQANLILRDDTVLGVCQALGEDFGVSPVWLRVVAATLLLWNPQAVIAGYLVLGVVVLASRLLFPRPRAAKAAEAVEAPAPAVEPEEQVELPLAA
jgi:phage shock protein PspC (stress-responsive transcriptional regulator)